MLRTGLSLCLLLACAAVADAREISGTLVYPQRIALPADSTAVIEMRAASGELLAENRFRIGAGGDAAQVPLPFSLDVPDDRTGTLRAGIWSGGGPTWMGGPIDVAAGAEALDVGPVRLEPFRPLGFTSRLRCGETEVEIGFVDQHARMRIDGETIDLFPVPAASGARYEARDEPGTFFWSKGETALVGIRGSTLPECHAGKTGDGQTFRATGNEPGWSVVIDGGRIRVDLDYGTRYVEAALPDPERIGDTTLYRLSDADITITRTERYCVDDMSGMPFPETVSVQTAERELRGCGGEPRSLLTGAAWRVAEVAGDPVPDDVEITLAFGDEGRLTGNGGCNRYSASYSLTGESLAIGLPAATKMACPEPRMGLEQAFFALLGDVVRFELGPSGALLLKTPDGRSLTARR
jgi:heat shock protein HslJ